MKQIKVDSLFMLIDIISIKMCFVSYCEMSFLSLTACPGTSVEHGNNCYHDPGYVLPDYTLMEDICAQHRWIKQGVAASPYSAHDIYFIYNIKNGG